MNNPLRIISCIIVFPIIYMMLGTIFGVLITLLKTNNLKLKTGLLVFLRPLAFTPLFAIFWPVSFDSISVWLSVILLAIILRDILFSNLRVLSKFTIFNDKLSIEYINAMLKRKLIDVSFDNITYLKLTEITSAINYPASLSFYSNDSLKRFIILNKETWDHINRSLHAIDTELIFSGRND